MAYTWDNRVDFVVRFMYGKWINQRSSSSVLKSKSPEKKNLKVFACLCYSTRSIKARRNEVFRSDKPFSTETLKSVCLVQELISQRRRTFFPCLVVKQKSQVKMIPRSVLARLKLLKERRCSVIVVWVVDKE